MSASLVKYVAEIGAVDDGFFELIQTRHTGKRRMRALQASERRVRTALPHRRVADRWLAHCDDAGNMLVRESEEAADCALVSEGEEVPGDACGEDSQAVAPPRRASQRCGLTERDGQHQSREYGGTGGKMSFGAVVPGRKKPWSPTAFTSSLSRRSAWLQGELGDANGDRRVPRDAAWWPSGPLSPQPTTAQRHCGSGSAQNTAQVIWQDPCLLASAYPATLRSGISDSHHSRLEDCRLTSFPPRRLPTDPIQRFVLQLKQRAVDLL